MGRRLESLRSQPRHLWRGEHRAPDAVMPGPSGSILFITMHNSRCIIHNYKDSGPSGLRPVDVTMQNVFVYAFQGVCQDCHGALSECQRGYLQSSAVSFLKAGRPLWTSDYVLSTVLRKWTWEPLFARGTVWSIRAQATVRKLLLVSGCKDNRNDCIFSGSVMLNDVNEMKIFYKSLIINGCL